MSTIQDTNDTISILRRIDREIDFARGSLQISILLELGKSVNGLAIRDLAKRLNERNKSIADALRKMMLKNIVEKTRNGNSYEIYMLTEHGQKLYEDLMKVVKGNGFASPIHKRKTNVMPHDFSLELIKKDYINDIVITIATSKKRIVSIKEIAESMGLSIQRAQAYLDMYSGRDAPIRLFKRVETSFLDLEEERKKTMPRILKIIGFKKKNNKVFYILTEDGLAVFHRLPFYTKYATSKTAKLIQKLFNSLHPRLVAKRLFRTLTIANISIAILSLSISISMPILSILLLLTSIIFSTSMLILYITTYNL